jgi:hypothetical protein
MRDPFATPWLVVIGLCLIPIAVALFAGAVTFRRLTPLVFHCRRCGRDFHVRPYRRFPASCPRCQASDWNSTSV